jgi:peroxiredoxin (alkyl hydroperoxide reductase subunit C)
VLGVSVDSKFCHKAWADSFGGIDFPLLADFHPKGEMAKAYGLWLDAPGITDRATVLIGKDGKVLWSESVGPGGARVPGDLLTKAEELGQ